MDISPLGLELVTHFEGFYPNAYLDPVGIWTIGYGHTDPAVAFEGNTITEAEARRLLAKDLDASEESVDRLVDVSVTQHEFDSLVSFVFNVGSGAFSKSTLRRKLNEGDKAGAANEFPRWNKGTIDGQKVVLPGLTRRRKSEQHLFLTGTLNFFDGHGIVDPDDDLDLASYVAGRSLAATGGGATDAREDFATLFSSWGITHFTASELLTMGGSHATPGSSGFQKNTIPPSGLWRNIRQTVVALDKLRMVLGAPVHLTSVYRSPAYNTAIGGVPGSLHQEFKAADFYAKSISGPSHWASVLKDLRSDGVFSGGIGVYDTFVHVDCRGTDIDF